MWNFIKSAIRKLLAVWGIGVYRLNWGSYSNPRFLKQWLNETGYPMYNAIIRLMDDHGLSCDGKHVADIGCGTGNLLLKISEKYSPASITGTEINESAIKIAEMTIANADIYNDNLLEPRIKRTFDVIFCTEVLEHLLDADKALSNLIARTNEQGFDIVTVPNGRTDTFKGHINYWSPESWDVFVKRVCKNCDIQTGFLPNSTKLFAIIKHQ